MARYQPGVLVRVIKGYELLKDFDYPRIHFKLEDNDKGIIIARRSLDSYTFPDVYFLVMIRGNLLRYFVSKPEHNSGELIGLEILTENEESQCAI